MLPDFWRNIQEEMKYSCQQQVCMALIASGREFNRMLVRELICLDILVFFSPNSGS
jgi:hypothetical protein